MRISKTLLFSALISLLLVSCSEQKENVLATDFDHFTQYLNMPVGEVCGAMRAEGYQVREDSLIVEERDFGTYSMKVTLVSDNQKVIDCIYLAYFPKDSDNVVTNEGLLDLIAHIGSERTFANDSRCYFKLMTNSPDYAEQVLATTLDEALTHRAELEASPSHDYLITYYWMETEEKIETTEQLYDYLFSHTSDTVAPNEAGITISSSLNNTIYPRPQLMIGFSCRY